MASFPSFLHRIASRVLSTASNGDEAIRRHIYWWLLIRVTFLTLLLTLTAFFMDRGNEVLLPPFKESVFFLLFIYGFSICSALFLRKLSFFSVQLFAMVQLLTDTFLLCLFIYATGCKQSIFTPALVLPIIVGGLILYRKGALILAAVATLGYGGTLALELLGKVPDYYFISTVYRPSASLLGSANLFAVYGLLFFFSALFSGQLARRLSVTEEALTRTVLKYDRLMLLYKQIVETINTGIITVDHQGFISSYNLAAEKITGYPREKVVGRLFTRCFPGIFIHGEDSGRQVCDFKKYDQSITRVGYTFTHLNMPIASDDEYNGPANWKVISMQDISQIEHMEQQVREAEKMAAIGEISASIAHDLRNPLAAISGSAQLLNPAHNTASPLDPATYGTLVDIILRESDRMAKTITDFLQFARPAPLVFEFLDMASVVNETIATLRSSDKHQQNAGKIRTLLPEHQYFCWLDQKQMYNALLQIMRNACQAMEGREGEIIVDAHEQAKKQNMIVLEIRDQGPGVPVELRDKVFTPFFSRRVDGAGLGLAIARQIVENHGGTVEIDELPDYACIVRIKLPQSQDRLNSSPS